MSNAQGIEAAIASLIKPGGLRAMMLFSEWGTGKTHLVREYFKTATAKEKLAEAKLTYAYVSLFGADSLAEVRRRLTVAALQSKGHTVLRTVKRLGGLLPDSTSIAGVDFDVSSLGDLASDFIQERVVRDLFVCLDDLERADQLEVSEILGLIAELTEQLDSKCVLIFNRSKLADARVAVLDASEEKVFDLSVEYHPSIGENLSHGFANAHDRAHAKPAFEAFRNGNIRIMRRTAWVLQTLRENGGEDATIWPQMVRHAAVLTILKHAYSTTVPDLPKAVAGTSQILRLFGQKTPGLFPEDVRAFLDELEFETAPYDTVILELLESGTLAGTALEAAVAAGREQHAKRTANVEHFRLWEVLRNGFSAAPAEFTARLKRFVAGPNEQVGLAEMAQLCDLLLQLDSSEENRRIVAAKFAAHFLHIPPETRAAALANYPAMLAAKIHEVMPYVAKNDGPTVAEVVKEIAGAEGSWDPKYFRDLARFTDAEIADHLLQQKGDKAIHYARRMLDRIRPEEFAEAEAIRTRLKDILYGIAKKHPLYRFQIEFFIKEKVPPDGAAG